MRAANTGPSIASASRAAPPPGSEFTGLYFDPTNKRRGWVNIQHPASDNDRTMEVMVR